MYFIFSGEGKQDLGQCRNGELACESSQYEHGPMAVVVDRLVDAKLGHSLLEGEYYGFLSERRLAERASEMKPKKKAPILPGKKRAKETTYFYRNARALASYAKERQTQLDDTVIAVLFRDSDGTASAGRGLWEDKRRSMIAGFDAEGFPTGVPMVPKPKSEAWLICALKKNPYQGCAALEDRSGNDNSPNPLKAELEGLLGHAPSGEELCGMLHDGTIDVERIDMPSFKAFKERLRAVV